MAVLFILLMGLYALFSYSQVDPNLILSSHPWYISFQEMMWRFGYEQRFWSSGLYMLLILALFLVYFVLLRRIEHEAIRPHTLKKLVITSIAVLSLSYPALSHDVFNYMFNAKMVVEYGADPHVSVALDYPDEPWLMFMHNVHTPAPYFYGWTLVSLVPYLLAGGYLQLVMLLLRFMMIGSMLLWLKGLYKLGGEHKYIFMLALNPLVLIETVGNIHNDIVMMALLIWSLYFAQKVQHGKKYLVAAILLFLLSVSIKYASIMLYVGGIMWMLMPKIKTSLSAGGAQILAHFAPLMTTRSQRFLPWYLIWSLSFLPFTKEGSLRTSMLIFTVTGMFSYVPYLYYGAYSPQILQARTAILFVPVMIYLGYAYLKKHSSNLA